MKKVTIIEAVRPKKSIRKIRVAAYARVSTSNIEQQESLKTQRIHFEELLDSRPDWEPVGLYVDDGLTGTSAVSRQGLQNLLADCRSGKIDLVLTKSISRLSRNIEDCLEIVRELNRLDVAIYFDKENLNTQTMDGELLLSILGSLAEEESRSISGNGKWGQRKRVEQGVYKHSSVPYGYCLQNGTLVINETEAERVREIFEWYLQGEGSYRIAGKLNAMKVPAIRGALWHDGTITNILTNEKYVGDFLYQKTYTDDHFKRHINRGDVDQLFIPDNHPAIISRSDFEKVQTLMRKRSESCSKQTQTVYPFTQKIKCGCCGGQFIRRTHYSSNRNRSIAWTCKTHLQRIEQCPMKFVSEVDLQEVVMTVVNKLIFGRHEILVPLIESLGQPDSIYSKETMDVNQKLRDCQEQFELLSKLRTEDKIDIAFYQEESQRIEQEKKEYLGLLRQGQIQDETVFNNLQALKAFNLFLSQQTNYFTDFDESLVTRYLEKIEVRSRLEFVLHWHGGLVVTERRKE